MISIIGDFTQIVSNQNKYCIFAYLKSRLINYWDIN